MVKQCPEKLNQVRLKCFVCEEREMCLLLVLSNVFLDPWYITVVEHLLVVRLVVGSIPRCGPTEIFSLPISVLQLL